VRRRAFLRIVTGAAVGPLPSRAQQRVTPVIGFLHPGSPEQYADLVTALRQGLGDTGYLENENAAIEYRWAEDRYERLPTLAADLVHRRVAVIAVTRTPAVLAAANVTSTIPIVFNFASNPAKFGLVASLRRPGGSVTGINSLSVELGPKQPELLCKVAPTAPMMALLANPGNSLSETMSTDLQAAARNLGVRLHVAYARTKHELPEVFANLSQARADGLVIAADVFLGGQGEQLASLALHYSMPRSLNFANLSRRAV
jgi:putative tryptophan/tyrosine transport system substrate-binding protein